MAAALLLWATADSPANAADMHREQLLGGPRRWQLVRRRPEKGGNQAFAAV